MIYLVGERARARSVDRWERLVEFPGDLDRWIALSLRMGAFRLGDGRAKLASIGLKWDRSLNLLPPHPVAGVWESTQAWRVAQRLLSSWLSEEDEVVMCGGRVAAAFGLGRWWEIGRSESGFTLAPHPSGRSRWWNDPERRRRFVEDRAELAWTKRSEPT